MTAQALAPADDRLRGGLNAPAANAIADLPAEERALLAEILALEARS